ncbi:hypothetical protein PR048_003311 [Dryococelus australis]|uniref:MADF domain-containing protein n=1 Tax=Dryococelus australis TaxID=614101 RepID=A0ABQ9IPS4_9NEOP|nr:hypothetical protein PR048_003311 [Dryococelus australis]
MTAGVPVDRSKCHWIKVWFLRRDATVQPCSSHCVARCSVCCASYQEVKYGIFKYRSIVFAELVTQHTCLYDLRHSQYKDNNVRENVWAEIGKQIGKTGKCRTQI